MCAVTESPLVVDAASAAARLTDEKRHVFEVPRLEISRNSILRYVFHVPQRATWAGQLQLAGLRLSVCVSTVLIYLSLVCLYCGQINLLCLYHIIDETTDRMIDISRLSVCLSYRCWSA